MIKYDEFCTKFCEIESRYKLFELEFNGIKYWKYARYYVYNVLLKMYGHSVPFWFDRENSYKLSQYTYKYQKITDSIFHNVNVGLKKDVLLFSFSRRVKAGNQYISPVTDEICTHMKRNCCVIEEPYCGGYYRPAPIWGIKYFDVWDGVGKESKVYEPLNRGQLRRQLLSIFEQEFGITFTSEEKKVLLVNINYFVMYRDELVANYKRVISKISPKLVLYTSAYIGNGVVLTETLKEMGIPSIEIAHGFQDDDCIAYNYSELGLNDALPDYIFVYSEIERESIKWGIPKDHIRVVGFPEGEKRSKELLAKRKKEKKKVITFISNANKTIEKYINYLSENIDADAYEIIFKLHPVEYGSWKSVYGNLSEKVHIVDHNEKDIHFYLANSDFVIGIVSTALIEAAFYPVDIFILDEEGRQGMKALLKTERAVLVHDGKELFSNITSGHSYCAQKDNSIIKRNAIENINTEIEKIMNENQTIK